MYYRGYCTKVENIIYSCHKNGGQVGKIQSKTFITTYNALYPMVSFTVGLSHAQYMHVSQRAEREGKSVNQVIQEIVEQEMNKENPK